MPGPVLVVVAWVFLAAGILSAAWIAFDIFVRGHRQRMGIMDAVWPITGLYFGVLAVLFYRRWGRSRNAAWLKEKGLDEAPETPHWVRVFVGGAHCGAGCTLGDIISETVIFAFGFTIAGVALWPEFIGDFVLALLLGIIFQYFAIAPMRGLDMRNGLRAAAKADILSLTAFEVGLFGWMALMYFVFFPGPHLTAASPAFWFLMQIGMVVGFFTAWPVNVWLIKRGIKEVM